MRPGRFLLGTHMPSWLSRATVPLFVSDTRLRERKRFTRAVVPWSVDSGGFTQLQKHGRWTFTPAEYVARLRTYRDKIGNIRWCAPMDNMCEPLIINGGKVGRQRFFGTRHILDPDGWLGLTYDDMVNTHQDLTVANLLELRTLAPDLWIIPVLQGYTLPQYLRCAVKFRQAGIDLTREPLVGLGSVCRRQATKEVHGIILALHQLGITRLHGFGVKTLGLQRYGHLLTSADSLAWSDVARKLKVPVCGTVHPRDAKNCANCEPFALTWRARLLASLEGTPPPHPPQLHVPLWNDDDFGEEAA
jgi:hypothetical protein